MNQEIQEVTPVIRKATPAADRLLALDAVRGLAVIGCLSSILRCSRGAILFPATP